MLFPSETLYEEICLTKGLLRIHLNHTINSFVQFKFDQISIDALTLRACQNLPTNQEPSSPSCRLLIGQQIDRLKTACDDWKQQQKSESETKKQKFDIFQKIRENEVDTRQ